MNERIKELAEQANAWYPDGYPSGEGGDAAWKDLVIFSKQDLGKFAELIVRECTDILFNESERLYGYSTECDNMRESEEAELVAEKCVDLITMIEEHLGV